MKKSNILNLLMEYKGFKTKKEFADFLGITKSRLGNWFSRDTFDEVMLMEKMPEIRRNWLITGEGDMFNNNQEIFLKNTVTPVPEEDYMMVEYVDLATNAGTLGGGIVADLDETHTRLVPREYDKGLYLVVRVSGNSMDDGTKKSLSDGDEVLVRLWQENIQYLPIKMKLFVVNTNDGSVIKQISNIDYTEKTLTLHSFNEEYKDYKLHFDDIVQIFTVEKIVNSKIRF